MREADNLPLTNNYIGNIKSGLQKTKSLAYSIPNLSIKQQEKVWFETWQDAKENKRVPIQVNIFSRLLQNLPSLYHHPESSGKFKEQLANICEDIRPLFDGIGSGNIAYIPATADGVQEGVALLFLHARRSFLLEIWKETREIDVLATYFYPIWIPIVPHLPSEQQASILSEMLYRNLKPIPELEQYLIKKWPEKMIEKTWEVLCKTHGERHINQFYYPSFAQFLIPLLPESYYIEAWQSARQFVNRYEWKDTFRIFFRSLPNEQTAQKIWDDLPKMEQQGEARDTYDFRQELIIHLDNKTMQYLLRFSSYPAVFDENIFTCSLGQYLWRGGFFVNRYWRGKPLNQQIQEWKPRFATLINQILLPTWGYLAYLFVPLFYLLAIVLKRLPVLKKINGFSKSILFRLFYWMPDQLHKIFIICLAPIEILIACLSPYYQIASQYALTRAEAVHELEKIILEDNDRVSRLIKARPLIDRIGGISLRQEVSTAYKDSQILEDLFNRLFGDAL